MNLDSTFALRKNQYPEIGTPDIRKKFGDELHNAREFNDMSIETVRSVTKINTQYLESIENGNWSFLPPVYVKMFIRAYAEAIKLQSEDFHNRLNEVFASIKQMENIPEVTDFFNDSLGEYSSSGSLSSLPIWSEKNKSLIIAVGLSVIAIIVILWLLLRSSGETPEVAVTEPAPANTEMLTPMNQTADTSKAVVKEDHAEATLEPTKVTNATENTSADRSGYFELNVIAKENCYVKVEHQDSVWYDRTLWPGNEMTKEFPEPIKLTLGNAPGVFVVVKDDTLPAFSGNRKVRVVRINSNGIIE